MAGVKTPPANQPMASQKMAVQVEQPLGLWTNREQEEKLELWSVSKKKKIGKNLLGMDLTSWGL